MRYIIVTLNDSINDDRTVLLANTVINILLWDGISPFDPGTNYKLIQSDTLQIGDMYSESL